MVDDELFPESPLSPSGPPMANSPAPLRMILSRVKVEAAPSGLQVPQNLLQHGQEYQVLPLAREFRKVLDA
jgi:hypothetical protein